LSAHRVAGRDHFAHTEFVDERSDVVGTVGKAHVSKGTDPTRMAA